MHKKNNLAQAWKGLKSNYKTNHAIFETLSVHWSKADRLTKTEDLSVERVTATAEDICLDWDAKGEL